VSAEDASVAPRAPESISELSCKHAPGRAELTSRTKFEPLAPERFALQVTIGQTAYDKLRRAQELLSHQLPSGDVAQVLERALDALVRQLERRKFAATDRPRRNRERASKDPRHIPAHVKRAVRERDGDQCTFASDAGHRCTARKFLEYDHIIEVARGGLPTVENLRLRCRVHNQYEAARTFGAGFMERKQREAADARERERPRALRELGARDPREKSDVARPPGVREPETAEAHVRPAEIDPETARDITNGLGNLGYRAPEIRRAIAHCRPLGSPNLDAHMRAALAFLRPRCVTLRPSVT
jgi:5-methylcytosine-specific restriction endonuclease McrA